MIRNNNTTTVSLITYSFSNKNETYKNQFVWKKGMYPNLTDSNLFLISNL